MGTAMKTVIYKEAQTLLELHKDGPHANIIRILGNGWYTSLPNHFYLDMELCNSNLHDYIYGDRVRYEELTSCEKYRSPVYVSKESPALVKWRNILAIMNHISTGLEFIHDHKQVHRDLKPRNGN